MHDCTVIREGSTDADLQALPDWIRDTLLLPNAQDAVIVTDLESRVTYWSEGATRLFGWTAGEMLGSLQSARFPAEVWASLAGQFETLAANQEWEGEIHDCRKDGTRVWVDARARRLTDGSGTSIGTLTVSRDISERKKMEEQVRRIQTMEAVGRLAGGIAHDFNNLLTIINGFSDLLQEIVRDDAKALPLVEEILRAGQRAAGLTNRLLAFSRKEIHQPRVLDLNALIGEFSSKLPKVFGEQIEMLLRLDPELARVEGDPGQLEQVLANLVTNAEEAMPLGGELAIETSNVDLSDSGERGELEVRPGRYVRLVVTDTGCGMDGDTQVRAFEPFFSTKELGKGSGLGLATVYGIIRQSGGYVFMHSNRGEGTCCEILLPAVPDPVPIEPSNKRLDERPGGPQIVLLVEDESGVRMVVRHVLEKYGYQVLEACDGAAALEVVSKHHGRIDALLTDVVMPGMSGPELAKLLLAERPGLKVLYMSGYTDDRSVRQDLSSERTAFIQKPFTTHALAEWVQESLGGRPLEPQRI